MVSPNTSNIVFAMTIVALAALIVAENDGKVSKCLNSGRHKAAPGREKLEKCKIYGNNACCLPETTERLYEKKDLYFFSNPLCKSSNLSKECYDFFLKDACFYECSPDINTWATEDGKDVMNIPLCKKDCDDWFSACSNEFTCTKDWKKAVGDRDFRCKDSDKCQTVKDKFKSADDFCKKVWGNSYDVVPDDSKCVKISLKSDEDRDQNANVAKQHTPSSSPTLTYNIIIVSLPCLLSLPSIA